MKTWLPEERNPPCSIWSPTDCGLRSKSWWTKYHKNRSTTSKAGFNYSCMKPLRKWCWSFYVRMSLEVHRMLIYRNRSILMQQPTGCRRSCWPELHSCCLLNIHETKTDTTMEQEKTYGTEFAKKDRIDIGETNKDADDSLPSRPALRLTENSLRSRQDGGQNVFKAREKLRTLNDTTARKHRSRLSITCVENRSREENIQQSICQNARPPRGRHSRTNTEFQFIFMAEPNAVPITGCWISVCRKSFPGGVRLWDVLPRRWIFLSQRWSLQKRCKKDQTPKGPNEVASFRVVWPDSSYQFSFNLCIDVWFKRSRWWYHLVVVPFLKSAPLPLLPMPESPNNLSGLSVKRKVP